MTLPANIVQKDRELQRSGAELMKLRWHWTKDESNAKRIGFAEYAEQVGVSKARIRCDANAFAKYLRAGGSLRGLGPIAGRKPGAPQTASDFRELEKMSDERAEAVAAVAAATGRTVTSVSTSPKDRAEVTTVLNRARERAEQKGTTIECEIPATVEWREKARRTAARIEDERKRQSTRAFLEIEGDISVAMARLRNVLTVAESQLDDEMRELITVSLGKMRALLGLIDLRIAGSTEVDWDAEFQKIAE